MVLIFVTIVFIWMSELIKVASPQGGGGGGSGPSVEITRKLTHSCKQPSTC